jgi:hypothetical protein
MAKEYEEKIADLLEEVDKFMELVEENAAAARQHIAKGRVGDASISVSGAYEFSEKAGKALNKLWALARRQRA